MNQIKYLLCDMWGSRYIDCDILQVKNSKYLIKYLDDNNKYVEKWTGKAKLKFPSFGDTVI